MNVDALLANDEQFMLAESQAVQGMCARAFPPEEEASGRVLATSCCCMRFDAASMRRAS